LILPAQVSKSDGQPQRQQDEHEFPPTAALVFLFIIVQQVFEIARTWSRLRIDAQTAALP
jgi:hypothetical protein